jgi:hypothetical protein
VSSDPSKTAALIHKLGAMTFVQPVDPKTLAVLVPILITWSATRPSACKTAVIIEHGETSWSSLPSWRPSPSSRLRSTVMPAS